MSSEKLVDMQKRAMDLKRELGELERDIRVEQTSAGKIEAEKAEHDRPLAEQAWKESLDPFSSMDDGARIDGLIAYLERQSGLDMRGFANEVTGALNTRRERLHKNFLAEKERSRKEKEAREAEQFKENIAFFKALHRKKRLKVWVEGERFLVTNRTLKDVRVEFDYKFKGKTYPMLLVARCAESDGTRECGLPYTVNLATAPWLKEHFDKYGGSWISLEKGHSCVWEKELPKLGAPETTFFMRGNIGRFCVLYDSEKMLDGKPACMQVPQIAPTY